MRMWLTGLALVLALGGTAPAFAQETAPARDEDRVEDIIVTAQRAGAPVWTVQRGDSTVILVGAIRGAARRADVKGEAVGFVRGDEVVDNLITQPPSAYEPCLAASIAAAEAGTGLFAERADDWRGLRVAEVIANPLDIALGQCWPYGDPTLGPQLRSNWLMALSTALNAPGVTLAVAPLRLLAEPGGVLDRLEADDLDVRGPDRKAEP